VSVDPKANEFSDWAPYVYCANNPINFIDPDGQKWWRYNTETKEKTEMGDNGGNDIQFVDVVTPGEDGGLVLEDSAVVNGSEFYVGRAGGKLYVSNVDYWEDIPEGLSGYNGYTYRLGDIKMRYRVRNEFSHCLKTGLRQLEESGIAEPLTKNNFESLYGHKFGVSHVFGVYFLMGLSLASGAQATGGVLKTPKGFNPTERYPRTVYFYRAMSKQEYKSLIENNGLTRMKGKELFVSTRSTYSRTYLLKKEYDVLVKFKMKPGTMNKFNKIGVWHRTPAASKGWSKRGLLMWKLEKGTLNLGIQDNTNAFNKQIDNFIKIY
jgi:hypothetical protein